MVPEQDRTGRIIFKLFDKDPSDFPRTLRTQVRSYLPILAFLLLIIGSGDSLMVFLQRGI